MIFDEVQYVPDLMPYIKERIDTRRGKTGQYLLTGSQNLLLTENVTYLVGRTAMLRLLPLSYKEISKTPQAAFPWERGSSPKRHRHAFGPLSVRVFSGGGIRNLPLIRSGTLFFGIRAMSRPTWNETSVCSGRSETSRSSRRSSARWRREAPSFSTSRIWLAI